MVASGAGGVQQTIAPYCDALLAAGNEVQAILYRKSPMIGEIRSSDAANEINRERS